MAWAPSGAALYVENEDQWKADLWRFAVNPGTMDLVAAERLTTAIRCAAAAAFLQRLLEVRARCLQGRSEAEQKSRRDRDT